MLSVEKHYGIYEEIWKSLADLHSCNKLLSTLPITFSICRPFLAGV